MSQAYTPDYQKATAKAAAEKLGLDLKRRIYGAILDQHETPAEIECLGQ